MADANATASMLLLLLIGPLNRAADTPPQSLALGKRLFEKEAIG